MVLTFLLFGVTQTPDGVFRRPHPGKHGEAQVLFMYTRMICCITVFMLKLLFTFASAWLLLNTKH